MIPNDAPVVFGLAAQGHIQTIETMLWAGCTWQQIASHIGWCAKTAKQHYQWHLEKRSIGAD